MNEHPTPEHREDDDAPRRKRRTLLYAVLAGLLLGAGAFVLLMPREAPTPVPVVTPPPPPPPPPPPQPPPPPPPPVEEPPPKPTKALPKPAKPQPSSTSTQTTIVLGTPTGGDRAVRETLQRAFQGALRGVNVAASSADGYAVTLAVDDQKQSGNEVTVRCTVSIAELPRKTLKASLRARADAAGEGVDADELFDDAAKECGKTLGGDLASWVKRNPR